MLWFKFFFGMKIYKQVNFFIFLCPRIINSQTKEKKINCFKIFKPKKNLNHNIYDVHVSPSYKCNVIYKNTDYKVRPKNIAESHLHQPGITGWGA